jgi:prepilin-type N-terminal cleavage/methylation domain-containing protein
MRSSRWFDAFVPKPSRGFTLIELMIVVAIIAILAIVAIPKFGSMVAKAREADVRGSLGALRSAVSIYYADNQIVPATLSNCLDVGQHYIPKIPSAKIPAHIDLNNPGHDLIGGDTPTLDDMATAAWLYIPQNGDSFVLAVNCSHLDTKGQIWSEY